MGSELAMVRPPATGALEFTPEQRQIIRDTYANGASDSEFAVLMEIARARRLNPLFRQIYFVQRYDSQKGRNVWATQVAIDGLRAVAERTGLYAGQDKPVHIYDEQDKARKRPICTEVAVWRKDWPRPAIGVAHYSEYVQTKRDGSPTMFWSEKPHVMLAKCAEALALRKAFPEDTSGLYVPEEMGDRAMIVDVHGEVMSSAPVQLSAPLQRFADELTSVETPEALRACWEDNRADLVNADDGASHREASRMMLKLAKSRDWARTSKEFDALLGKGEPVRAVVTQAAPVAAAPTVSDAVMVDLIDRMKRCTQPADLGRLRKVGAEIKALGLPESDPQRADLVTEYAAAQSRCKVTPPDGPKGGAPKPEATAPSDDPERAAIAGEPANDAGATARHEQTEAWALQLASYTDADDVAFGYAKRRSDYPALAPTLVEGMALARFRALRPMGDEGIRAEFQRAADIRAAQARKLAQKAAA